MKSESDGCGFWPTFLQSHNEDVQLQSAEDNKAVASLRLMTHETFVAGLLLRNFAARNLLRVCHTLLQSLATSCAAKF